MTMSKGMSHKVEICHLKKGVHRCRLVVLAGSLHAYRSQSWRKSSVRFQKETVAAISSPSRQIISTRFDLISHFLCAKNQLLGVGINESVPESRAEVQAVVQVLGLDEDVGIQEVTHVPTTPRLRPNSLNVESLENPSIRKASV
jgi:hypothetical protein